MNEDARRLRKRQTGIRGLDAMTRGGLPAAGATLVMGQAGAGKTILGLQVAAHAVAAGDAAVVVSFEESRDALARDAVAFRWGDPALASDSLALIDARPPTGALVSGGFDMEGVVALVDQERRRLGASWVVLDGIDRLLALQPDDAAAVEEVIRLQNWCTEAGVSLLLTGKISDPDNIAPGHLEGIEFLLDTVLVLGARVLGNRLNRRLRIAKYRGTAHVTSEVALVIDHDGIHLGYDDPPAEAVTASNERVGTGIPRLDDVLGGGVYRGSTTLISGLPGTSKTTLAASVAATAAARGDTVLYVSFDELADRIVRNAASVGIDLATPMDSGHLHMRTREAWRALVEEHYVAITHMLAELAPDCLVIDPVSALLKATRAESALETVERLLSSARAQGITTVLTSLNESDTADSEATVSQASTIADTWISLSYHVYGGERNRAMSVVKSRGTAHSNQVRELVLSHGGVDLADVYQYGTEVLMGTARLQKEAEEASALRREQAEHQQRRQELERRIAQARARLEEADSETRRLQEELTLEDQSMQEAQVASSRHQRDVRARREPGPEEEEEGM